MDSQAMSMKDRIMKKWTLEKGKDSRKIKYIQLPWKNLGNERDINIQTSDTNYL